MSLELTFWYKRREKVNDKGEELIVEFDDCINLYEVCRGWWEDGHTFLLQMKDAHEESREKEFSPNPQVNEEMKAQIRKRNQEIPKERKWVLSYIPLRGIDIVRYRMATEMMLEKTDTAELELMYKKIQPQIIGKPKAQPTPGSIDVTQTVSPTTTTPEQPVETVTSTEPIVVDPVTEGIVVSME